MKVFIKHISPIYIDASTFDDAEGPELIPSHVEVHYEFYKDQNQLVGKTAIDFKEYETMKHSDVVEVVTQEIKGMFNH